MNSEEEPKRQPGPVRLAYIDGIRALAALYVMLAHTFYEPQNGYYASGLINHLGLNYARVSVAVFIVVSGFCLMLPIARRGDQMGSLRTFFQRRIWRILPPYYCCLVLSILFIVFFAHAPTGTVWDNCLPLTRSSIVCHFLMVHDLPLFTGGRINYTFWSIAVEFQIYFLMPLIVVSIRRLRPALTLAWTLVAGIGLYLLSPTKFENAAPWYLSLFTMGVIAAHACVHRPEFFRHPKLRQVCYIGCVLVALAVRGIGTDRYYMFRCGMDQFVGAAVALLLAVTYFDSAARPSIVTRFLSWRPLVRIGLFSYSLYLVHAVALHALWLVLRRWRAVTPEVMFGQLLLCTPLVVLSAWVFHLAFERPFLMARRAKPAPAREAKLETIRLAEPGISARTAEVKPGDSGS